MAGALAAQALAKSGDAAGAKRARQLVQASYGDRLPREAAARPAG